MKSMIFFTVGALIGGLLVLLLRPAPEQVAVVEAVAVSASTEDPAPTTSGLSAQRGSESATCAWMLALMRGEHEETLAERSDKDEMLEFLAELVERTGADSMYGNPMTTFPEQLERPFIPDTFEEAVKEIQERCPEIFPEGTTADCEEFPCLITMSTSRHPTGMDFDETCPDFADVFGRKAGGMRASSIGDEHRVQVYVQPRGVGVGEYLQDHQDNLRKRMMFRHQSDTERWARANFEGPCLEDGDAQACLNLGRALDHDPEDRDRFLHLACERNQAAACHTLASSRCITRSICDATALSLAQKAVALDPTSAGFLHTLAVIYCQQGNVAYANDAWKRSCDAGRGVSCSQTCDL